MRIRLPIASGNRKTRCTGSVAAPACRSVVIWRMWSAPSTSGFGPCLMSSDILREPASPNVAETVLSAAWTSRVSAQRLVSTRRPPPSVPGALPTMIDCAPSSGVHIL